MSAKESGFNFNNVYVRTNSVQALTDYEIAETRDNYLAAITNSLEQDRARQFAGNFGVTSSKQQYIKTHRKPALAFPGQSFRNVSVIRAMTLTRKGPKVTGHLYTADNTSGNFVERELKMLAPAKLPKFGGHRYVHLREIAVPPTSQHHGIAHHLVYNALRNKSAEQPVTAYTWPTELGAIGELLESWGMEENGDTPPQAIYGPQVEPVRQVGWIGKAGAIRQAILETPGFHDALSRSN